MVKSGKDMTPCPKLLLNIYIRTRDRHHFRGSENLKCVEDDDYRPVQLRRRIYECT